MTIYFNKKIIYIIENAEWSIFWDGHYITKKLRKDLKIPSATFDIVRLDKLPDFKKKILHFGSRSTFLPENYKLVNKNNKIVFTYFHGTDEDTEYIKSLPEGSRAADIIHTSCSITRDQLIKWGAEEDKIVVIPLGVDLSSFIRIKQDDKKRIKAELDIPEDSICVGSFQKDGVGWSEGCEPKLEKGPDIFCDLMKKLNKDFNIFVLLTGPARGYVKKRLESDNIKYKHVFLDDYLDIPRYYQALDYYAITSRAEGGPKAILECWASGVPFVTTRVGMAKDVIKNGINGLVSDVDDSKSLFKDLTRLISDDGFRERLINEGSDAVKKFDWSVIVKKYYEKIYSKLL